ncbi:putative receptor protein kinase ZmPK1 [Camellia lanceoleosa]|uniref:Receptor protein kinase ZmPK1 n=1 Tax=Camellia lanceoleosa TaxID=1840588 RepID=A0ACC0HLT0_9ERIC|nr:putative receptor protein kinase ZmPK1 [Camellia lanceoleosa]
MYSLDEKNKIWNVTWQAKSQPCKIHGIYGPNSLCTYVLHEKSGRRCSCIPGYKIKNKTNQSLGCKPDFNLSCNGSEVGFLQLPYVEFYGYDIRFDSNYTSRGVRMNAYKDATAMGFNTDLTKFVAQQKLQETQRNGSLQFMVWFASAIGGVKIICICLVLYLLYRNCQNSSATTQSYLQVATGLRKFTYDELKKATHKFGEEIGKGSGDMVYKGVLSNRRVATIKRLNEANQGEDEFLAEVSTSGRVNHKNLIEVWGYCVDGKHRLLVYEYMERRSLAENLTSNTLD